MKLVSTNPSDAYAVLGEVEMSTREDVARAVSAGRSAQQAWAMMPVESRCEALRSFGAQARARFDEICDLIALETGRVRSGLPGHVTYGLDYLDAYCESAPRHLAPVVTAHRGSETHTVYREPWGVVAAICPWNYPFLNVLWQCGQALLAGNAVVYKNSEENPLFARLLADLFAASDVPNDVFTVLYGDGEVGNWLAESDVDMLSFTGSSATGRSLARLAAQKLIPFVGELGGSSPCIVFDDIDVNEIAEAIFWGRFFNAGQTCDAVKRLIVHESNVDELTALLVNLAKSVKVGPAMDPSTQMGPLVAERQVARIEKQVAEAVAKGAVVLTGGGRCTDLDGAYFQPTILTNITHDMSVWNEETFGPVLPIVPFADEREAIALANDSMYGLTAHVRTANNERFARVAARLQAGSVIQNDGYYDHPESPFGGYKQSGLGRTNGSFGFHEYTQAKLVSSQA